MPVPDGAEGVALASAPLVAKLFPFLLVVMLYPSLLAQNVLCFTVAEMKQFIMTSVACCIVVLQ